MKCQLPVASFTDAFGESIGPPWPAVPEFALRRLEKAGPNNYMHGISGGAVPRRRSLQKDFSVRLGWGSTRGVLSAWSL